MQRRLHEDTARWFSTPLVITYQNETPGLLTSEAERLGKITIGTELGWGGAVSYEGVRYGRHGVRAAAIHHGQLIGTIDRISHHADGSQRKVSMVVPSRPSPGITNANALLRLHESGRTRGLVARF